MNNNPLIPGLHARFTEGRIVRVMAMGDSLTAGTSSLSGWRAPLKRILSNWGYSNWEFVGSQSSNPEFLGDHGRDWLHEGYGGYQVPQLTAIVADRINTYKPDLLIMMAGSNIPIPVTRPEMRTAYNDFFDAVYAVDNLPILSLSRPPAKTSGIWLMDTFVQSVIAGHKDACRDQQEQGRPVWALSPHDPLRQNWSPDWYLTGDNTHYNAIGYYQLALAMAEQIVGAPAPNWGHQPVHSQLISTVGADIDFPAGARVTKTAAADTVNVLTFGGSQLTIPASWPAHVPWPVPVVRIYQSGTTLRSPLVVARHPYGAKF